MHKFGNTKTGTEQKAENNYTDDRIKQQKRGVLVVLVRTIWKILSVRSRALEKFFCLFWKKKNQKNRDNYCWTKIWHFQDKGRYTNNDCIWLFSPQNSDFIKSAIILSFNGSRKFSLLISWWHTANCFNPFVGGRGRWGLFLSVILAYRRCDFLGASCSKAGAQR